MQIPSVRSLYQARSGAVMGRPVFSQPQGDGFSGVYAQALAAGTVDPSSQELVIEGGPAVQPVPAGGSQWPATAASPYFAAGQASGLMPLYIPASQVQAPAAAVPYHADRAAEIVAFAKQFVGTPYVRGGEDLRKGADCSGFVQSVFKHFGVSLPRSSYRQSMVGQQVDVKDLKPGDLLFFKTDDYAPVTHVAMYVGDGKIIHASSVKTGVIISKLRIKEDFVIARRIV